MSQPQPAVFIGITTYNRCDILPKALASAAEQSYANKRIMVIDDLSSDGTPALRGNYPEVEWIRNEVSAGLRENRNRMMQVAGIDYYVSLDDDAWFLRGDEISIAVARMEADPRLGAIAFDILSPTEPDSSERSDPRETRTFIGCGHLLRVDAVREAGWYESSPGAYGAEEKDLCIRLIDRGYRIELLPGVHIWHDKAWNGRDWFPLHRSGVCNDLVMATRRCPAPAVIAVVPYKMLSHLRFALRKREMMRATVAGIGMYLRHLPSILRSRKPVKRAAFQKATGR